MTETDVIRSRIKRYRLTNVWMIGQLKEHGIVTDKTELSSVYAGTRKGLKAEAIIKTSELILDDYEKRYVSAVQ